MEGNAICYLVNGDDPMDWPDIAGQPVNEFRTPGLATQAFPNTVPLRYWGSHIPGMPKRGARF